MAHPPTPAYDDIVRKGIRLSLAMAGWHRPAAPGGGLGAYAFERGILRQRNPIAALQILKHWGIDAGELAYCDVSTAGGASGNAITVSIMDRKMGILSIAELDRQNDEAAEGEQRFVSELLWHSFAGHLPTPKKSFPLKVIVFDTVRNEPTKRVV